MRETIFRGKRVDNGEWVYGVPIKKYGKTYIIKDTQSYAHTTYKQSSVVDFLATAYEVVPKSVGEYTNLTDKNGVKIFEWDRVAFIDCTSTENGHSEQYCVGEVIWCEETLSFEVTNRMSAESYEVLAECVIIGNIHDNPEC